jgi:hypothetical protein
MSAPRGISAQAAENGNDEKWEQLFQKTTEAIRLFGERPDLLRAFVDALNGGDFFKDDR